MLYTFAALIWLVLVSPILLLIIATNLLGDVVLPVRWAYVVRHCCRSSFDRVLDLPRPLLKFLERKPKPTNSSTANG